MNKNTRRAPRLMVVSDRYCTFKLNTEKAGKPMSLRIGYSHRNISYTGVSSNLSARRLIIKSVRFPSTTTIHNHTEYRGRSHTILLYFG